MTPDEIQTEIPDGSVIPERQPCEHAFLTSNDGHDFCWRCGVGR